MGTLDSGEIDYAELESLLARNASRPAILNVNIGTTVKGAVDDLDRVLRALAGAGYGEDRFFIHCDGALFGMMVGGWVGGRAGGGGCRVWGVGGGVRACVRACMCVCVRVCVRACVRACTLQLVSPTPPRPPRHSAACLPPSRIPPPTPTHMPAPPPTHPPTHPTQIPFVKKAPMVSFKKPIGSISVSGHKFVGSPVPCGVVMTRARHIKVCARVWGWVGWGFCLGERVLGGWVGGWVGEATLGAPPANPPTHPYPLTGRLL